MLQLPEVMDCIAGSAGLGLFHPSNPFWPCKQTVTLQDLGRDWQPMQTVSLPQHSTTCMAHTHTHQAQSPCSYTGLQGLLWSAIPLCAEQTFQKMGCFFCRCGGQWPLGYAMPALSLRASFWMSSFFCFILVLDVIFLQGISFSVCGNALASTRQLPWKQDRLISAATLNKVRMDSLFQGGKMRPKKNPRSSNNNNKNLFFI